MANANLPWFKFFPGDWLKDANLRRAGHAAKGFYIDFLCIAYECEERGVFATSGSPWSDEEVASAINGDSSENLRLLRRLLDLTIISRNENGAIVSRRIVKDEAKRKACSEAGKKGGGSPHLSKANTDSTTFKHISKGQNDFGLNPYIRSQKSEVRDQNLETRDQVQSLFPPNPPEGESRPAQDHGDEIREVFDHYRTYHAKAFKNPVSSSKEWKAIRSRLAEGYSADDLKAAIDGCHVCPHNCGVNERGQKYQGLFLILKSGDQVSRFIDEWENRNSPVLTEKTRMNNRAAQSYLERKGFGDDMG